MQTAKSTSPSAPPRVKYLKMSIYRGPRNALLRASPTIFTARYNWTAPPPELAKVTPCSITRIWTALIALIIALITTVTVTLLIITTPAMLTSAANPRRGSRNATNRGAPTAPCRLNDCSGWLNSYFKTTFCSGSWAVCIAVSSSGRRWRGRLPWALKGTRYCLCYSPTILVRFGRWRTKG